MDTQESSTNAEPNTDGLQSHLHEYKSQIKRAIVAIELAQRHLQDSISQQDRGAVINQVVQHSAMLPTILAQQLKMIEGLEHKFGDRFTINCREEIAEIAQVAKNIQSALENATANGKNADRAEEGAFAELVFGSTARLNILQQRIAGKMMKVK